MALKRKISDEAIGSRLFTSTGHLQVALNVDKTPTLSNDLAPQNYYEIKHLKQLRDQLNDVKSQLDLYHQSDDRRLAWAWNKFNNIVDIYRSMRFRIQHPNGEFNGQIVTNAWMKYYEIIRHYGLVDRLKQPGQTVFKAFFNAELPGAALCAFNHYMKTNARNLHFEWWASSLAPNEGSLNEPGSTCLGDQYGLYECNKSRWLMTKENNGDMTILKNLLDFERRLGPQSSYGGVDFYSHDAGIDVSQDENGQIGYNQQESANARIHLGCALAGFMTLKNGGCFVAKQYTFFETLTWNLIIIYASLFEEFYLCKPLTSRPRNSEIYLVGKGFRGLPSHVRALLMERLENFNASPLLAKKRAKEEYTETLRCIKRFATKVFKCQQIECIKSNLELFEESQRQLSKLENDVAPLLKQKADRWLTAYELKKIEDKDKLPCFPTKRY